FQRDPHNNLIETYFRKPRGGIFVSAAFYEERLNLKKSDGVPYPGNYVFIYREPASTAGRRPIAIVRSNHPKTNQDQYKIEPGGKNLILMLPQDSAEAGELAKSGFENAPRLWGKETWYTRIPRSASADEPGAKLWNGRYYVYELVEVRQRAETYYVDADDPKKKIRLYDQELYDYETGSLLSRRGNWDVFVTNEMLTGGYLRKSHDFSSRLRSDDGKYELPDRVLAEHDHRLQLRKIKELTSGYQIQGNTLVLDNGTRVERISNHQENWTLVRSAVKDGQGHSVLKESILLHERPFEDVAVTLGGKILDGQGHVVADIHQLNSLQADLGWKSNHSFEFQTYMRDDAGTMTPAHIDPSGHWNSRESAVMKVDRMAVHYNERQDGRRFIGDSLRMLPYSPIFQQADPVQNNGRLFTDPETGAPVLAPLSQLGFTRQSGEWAIDPVTGAAVDIKTLFILGQQTSYLRSNDGRLFGGKEHPSVAVVRPQTLTESGFAERTWSISSNGDLIQLQEAPVIAAAGSWLSNKGALHEALPNPDGGKPLPGRKLKDAGQWEENPFTREAVERKVLKVVGQYFVSNYLKADGRKGYDDAKIWFPPADYDITAEDAYQMMLTGSTGTQFERHDGETGREETYLMVDPAHTLTRDALHNPIPEIAPDALRLTEVRRGYIVKPTNGWRVTASDENGNFTLTLFDPEGLPRVHRTDGPSYSRGDAIQLTGKRLVLKKERVREVPHKNRLNVYDPAQRTFSRKVVSPKGSLERYSIQAGWNTFAADASGQFRQRSYILADGRPVHFDQVFRDLRQGMFVLRSNDSVRFRFEDVVLDENNYFRVKEVTAQNPQIQAPTSSRPGGVWALDINGDLLWIENLGRVSRYDQDGIAWRNKTRLDTVEDRYLIAGETEPAESATALTFEGVSAPVQRNTVNYFQHDNKNESGTNAAIYMVASMAAALENGIVKIGMIAPRIIYPYSASMFTRWNARAQNDLLSYIGIVTQHMFDAASAAGKMLFHAGKYVHDVSLRASIWPNISSHDFVESMKTMTKFVAGYSGRQVAMIEYGSTGLFIQIVRRLRWLGGDTDALYRNSPAYRAMMESLKDHQDERNTESMRAFIAATRSWLYDSSNLPNESKFKITMLLRKFSEIIFLGWVYFLGIAATLIPGLITTALPALGMLLYSVIMSVLSLQKVIVQVFIETFTGWNWLRAIVLFTGVTYAVKWLMGLAVLSGPQGILFFAGAYAANKIYKIFKNERSFSLAAAKLGFYVFGLLALYLSVAVAMGVSQGSYILLGTAFVSHVAFSVATSSPWGKSLFLKMNQQRFPSRDKFAALGALALGVTLLAMVLLYAGAWSYAGDPVYWWANLKDFITTEKSALLFRGMLAIGPTGYGALPTSITVLIQPMTEVSGNMLGYFSPGFFLSMFAAFMMMSTFGRITRLMLKKMPGLSRVAVFRTVERTAAYGENVVNRTNVGLLENVFGTLLLLPLMIEGSRQVVQSMRTFSAAAAFVWKTVVEVTREFAAGLSRFAAYVGVPKEAMNGADVFTLAGVLVYLAAMFSSGGGFAFTAYVWGTSWKFIPLSMLVVHWTTLLNLNEGRMADRLREGYWRAPNLGFSTIMLVFMGIGDPALLYLGFPIYLAWILGTELARYSGLFGAKDYYRERHSLTVVHNFITGWRASRQREIENGELPVITEEGDQAGSKWRNKLIQYIRQNTALIGDIDAKGQRVPDRDRLRLLLEHMTLLNFKRGPPEALKQLREAIQLQLEAYRPDSYEEEEDLRFDEELLFKHLSRFEQLSDLHRLEILERIRNKNPRLFQVFVTENELRLMRALAGMIQNAGPRRPLQEYWPNMSVEERKIMIRKELSRAGLRGELQNRIMDDVMLPLLYPRSEMRTSTSEAVVQPEFDRESIQMLNLSGKRDNAKLAIDVKKELEQSLKNHVIDIYRSLAVGKTLDPIRAAIRTAQTRLEIDPENVPFGTIYQAFQDTGLLAWRQWVEINTGERWEVPPGSGNYLTFKEHHEGILNALKELSEEKYDALAERVRPDVLDKDRSQVMEMLHEIYQRNFVSEKTRLSSREKILLEVAAILHDQGRMVTQDARHPMLGAVLAEPLIDSIGGFSPSEKKVLMALTAREHLVGFYFGESVPGKMMEGLTHEELLLFLKLMPLVYLADAGSVARGSRDVLGVHGVQSLAHVLNLGNPDLVDSILERWPELRMESFFLPGDEVLDLSKNAFENMQLHRALYVDDQWEKLTDGLRQIHALMAQNPKFRQAYNGRDGIAIQQAVYAFRHLARKNSADLVRLLFLISTLYEAPEKIRFITLSSSDTALMDQLITVFENLPSTGTMMREGWKFLLHANEHTLDLVDGAGLVHAHVQMTGDTQKGEWSIQMDTWKAGARSEIRDPKMLAAAAVATVVAAVGATVS
ncbi:MAG: hypothetical protein KBC91_03445, partial [Candidatus Omnitrophica bacterium]|nr:hypothetical protein [Candidatus Omnitrophota bacterium]